MTHRGRRILSPARLPFPPRGPSWDGRLFPAARPMRIEGAGCPTQSYYLTSGMTVHEYRQSPKRARDEMAAVYELVFGERYARGGVTQTSMDIQEVTGEIA